MDPDQLDRRLAARCRRRPTSRRRCTSRTISGRISTRPATTARRGRRSSTAFPTNAFTRVIREDPNHKGLLVAGTEFGLYISYDDGENWKPFQLNLPITPITDVAFHKREQELVVATQGRVVLRARRRAAALPVERQRRRPKTRTCSSRRTRIASARAARGGGGGRGGAAVGENPPGGAVVYYSLKDQPQGDVTLEFLDSAGKVGQQVFQQGRGAAARAGRRTTRRIRSAPPARARAGAGGHESLRVEPALSRRDQLSRADHVGGERHRAARRRRGRTRSG